MSDQNASKGWVNNLVSKSETISRLKANFLEKVKENSRWGNVNKEVAERYWDAFLRSVEVSSKFYSRMLKKLDEFDSKNLSKENVDRLDKSFKSFKKLNESKSFRLVKEKGSLRTFLKKDEKLIDSLKEFNEHTAEIINNKNIYGKVEEVVEKVKSEQDLVKKFNNNPDFFFDLKELEEIEKVLQEEEEIAKKIRKQVKKIEKFLERLKDDFLAFEKEVPVLVKSVKEHPGKTAISPFEKGGKFLEEHASVFASVVTTLSVLSFISGPLGLGVGVMTHIVRIVAEGGESLQAIPAVEEGYDQLKSAIKDFYRTTNSA